MKVGCQFIEVLEKGLLSEISYQSLNIDVCMPYLQVLQRLYIYCFGTQFNISRLVAKSKLNLRPALELSAQLKCPQWCRVQME